MRSILGHMRRQFVAYLALFVALGGTSYAATSLPANSVGSKQLKKNAVTTKKIKNHVVTAAKINPAGLTVPKATSATDATHATNASHATTADSAEPVAYAHVMSDGTLDSAHSKNVTAVSEPNPGWYCMKVTVPVNGVTATVDGAENGEYGFGTGFLAGQDPSNYIGLDCPAGSNAFIGTADATGGNAAEAIWVAFF